MEQKQDFMQRFQMRLLEKWNRRQQPITDKQQLDVVDADPQTGLTAEQVRSRAEAGWISGKPRAAGKTEQEIVFANIFTFFNLVFVILAVMLVLGGSSVKNMTFLIVAACNAVIGIVQEIRAKHAVDQLTLVAARPVTLIRDGKKQEVVAESIVRDDIALFGPGDTLCADGILRSGELQVNESLITGEADAVRKLPGDELKSGSIVIAGHGAVQLTAVGEDSFAAKLTAEAKANPRASKSEMMRSLDKLIKVVGIALIPVGLILFHQEYMVLKLPLRDSVEGTVAALVGMIPEGLYLLTSIAMAASALKLSRENVLVQDMNCIESLARVDVLCVDKTGTVTEPGMELVEVLSLDDSADLTTILTAVFSVTTEENATSRALQAAFRGESHWILEHSVPFTSERKWAGFAFRERGIFLTGAPEVLLGDRFAQLRDRVQPLYEAGQRVLLVAGYRGELDTLDCTAVTPLALLVLQNRIRPEAAATFAYFAKQGVTVKVISGDAPAAVSAVACRAGIPGAERFIDTTGLETDVDFLDAAQNYTVFGRVTPEKKQKLIRALKDIGHTVAMTGDGVNDALAMKEADCSIAMASGAQAANRVASMVLLDSDFDPMPGIVNEGRRVINNIRRSATLFLVKNIFSLGMTLVTLFSGLPFPLESFHMSIVSSLTIGIPGFFLALEPNYDRVQGRFLSTAVRKAFPGGLTNILVVLLAQILGQVFDLPTGDTQSICTAVLCAVGLAVLLWVSIPFSLPRRLVWFGMAVCVVGAFFVLPPVTGFLTITAKASWLVLLIVLIAAPTVFLVIHRLFALSDRLIARIRKRGLPC